MNDFYNVTGSPGNRAGLSSAVMRSELAAVAAGFEKLPPLSGNALNFATINAAGTGMTSLTVAQARTALSVAASGANADITSLTALTGGKATVARAANTILVAADFGKLFKATGTFTQTLTAAATLGDGWFCDYRNDGTGVITIDPNAAETIDGAATLALNAGDSCKIFCDGSNFFTVGRAASQINPAFSVHRNGVAQGIANNTVTKIGFTTEEFDTNNNFDNVTNSRFTPTVAGKYQINFGFLFASAANQLVFFGGIYKNGALYKIFEGEGSGAGATGGSCSAVVDFNGSTDYVEFNVFQLFGGAVNLDGNSYATYASGVRVA